MYLPFSKGWSLMWLSFFSGREINAGGDALGGCRSSAQYYGWANDEEAPIYKLQLEGPVFPFTFQGKWDYFCKKDIFVELMPHVFELFPKRCIHECLKHFESSVIGGALAISWQCDVFVFGLQFSSWLPHHTAVGMSLWISMKWHGLFCLVDLVFPKLVLFSSEPVVNIRLW